MTVGQALKVHWQKECDAAREINMAGIYASGMVSLFEYLSFNYTERYVKLCQRINVQPIGMGAWLRKTVESIQ